jgi:hypothetical protein
VVQLEDVHTVGEGGDGSDVGGAPLCRRGGRVSVQSGRVVTGVTSGECHYTGGGGRVSVQSGRVVTGVTAPLYRRGGRRLSRCDHAGGGRGKGRSRSMPPQT